MRPDASLFHENIHNVDFLTGADKGMWGVHDEDPGYANWPAVIIWVEAATKAGRPDAYHFKFDLAGYSSVAPTACPWDIHTNSRLESNLWPKGSKFVSNTFNPNWNPNALYAPCDRIAMAGHNVWQTQFPDLWWQPSFRITIYLQFLHRLLNSSDYAKS